LRPDFELLLREPPLLDLPWLELLFPELFLLEVTLPLLPLLLLELREVDLSVDFGLILLELLDWERPTFRSTSCDRTGLFGLLVRTEERGFLPPVWLPERLFQILVPFFLGSTGLIFRSLPLPRERLELLPGEVPDRLLPRTVVGLCP
jgi:hypothetical protein